MNRPMDSPKQFFRSDRRTELTSALGFVADLVETALDPARRDLLRIFASALASAAFTLGHLEK